MGEDECVEVAKVVGQHRTAGGADPVDGAREAGGTLDHVDAHQLEVGPTVVEVGQELTAPAREVDHAAYAGFVGKATHDVGKDGTQPAVCGGREVPRGTLGAAIEPVRPIERVPPRVTPGPRTHPRNL